MTGPKRRRHAQINPGRLAAGRALLAVERGAHAEDMLASLAPPEGPDRRLAWHLTLGVLRRQGALDRRLAEVSGRPLRKVDPPARVALRLGLFEQVESRTAPHAAVDQAVELCRRLGGRRATGFVNAVLRRAGSAPLPDDPWLELPTWLVDRWRPDMEDWVRRLSTPPPLCGVWRDPAAPVPELKTRPVTAGGVPVPGAFALPQAAGAVDALPGFADGAWWVMDPAAAAIADLCRADAGDAVLDACAAPGGKSLRLAARGARVVATDLSPDRLARVEEASRRTGLPIQTRVHDWLRGPADGLGQFDVVLVDAPCTGLGTIRRHPEIRWRRQPTDPAAMALRQRRILANASAHVAEGGRLVYAVCSPMPEEGEAVIEALSGWTVREVFATVPPAGDEDAFQGFVLERAGEAAIR